MAAPGSLNARIASATSLLLTLAVTVATPVQSAAASPSPPHDDFVDALTASSTNGSTTMQLEGSTFQAGEPGSDGSSGWGSVWITWTAPDGGTWTVTSDNSADQRVAIYTGNTLGTLTPLPVDYCAGDLGVSFAATAGMTYRWQLTGPAWQSAPAADVSWAPTPVGNDDFADAVPLGGGTRAGRLQGNHSVTTCTSTGSEPGEPSLGVGRTVWFSWTAPDTIAIRFNTSLADNLALAAYRGSQVSALTRVGATSSQGEVRFRAVAGTTYRIQVGVAEGGATPASGTLSWIHPVAYNDLLAYAQPLPRPEQQPYARSGTVLTDNVGAGREAAEPALDPDRSGRSLWWQVTPTIHGRLVLDTSGSQVDTVIGLYRRVGDGLSFVAKADDGGSTPGAARLEADVDGGAAEYVVLVDSMGASDGGIDLRWRLVHPAPRNDDFADRIRLTQASGTAKSWTFSATRERGEPAHGGVSSGRTVWWEYVAPRDGEVVVTTTVTQAFAVYRGPSVGSLSAVGEEVASAWPYRRLTFAVVAGRAYAIAVGTDANRPASPVAISWETNPPRPPNDDRADALPIARATGRLTISTVGATFEAEQGESSAEATVWFSWRATHTGWETFDTTGSQAATGLVVHPPGDRYWATLFGRQGSDLHRPTAYPNGQAKVYVRVVEGRSYAVQLRTSVAGANTVRLAWHPGGPPGRPGNDDLADARELPGVTQGSISSTLSGATYQPGESPLLDECMTGCGYDQGDHGPSVWFRWTAPGDGVVRFDTGPEGAGVWMSLYESATTVGALQPVGDPVIGTPGRAYTGTTLDARVQRGSTYALRVSSLHGDGFALHWRQPAGAFPAPPANDDLADAMALPGSTSGSVAGTAEWATLQSGEPMLGGRDIRESVWYRWVAPQSGRLTIGVPPYNDQGSTSHSTSVWTGPPGATLGQLVAVQPPGIGDPVRRPTIDVAAGTTYYVQVGSDARHFTLGWDLTRPDNDDLSDAFDLGGAPTGVGPERQVVRATVEPDEPSRPGGQPVQHTVWMRWTPNRSGPVSFDSGGDGQVPALDVFTSATAQPTMSGLTRVAAGDLSADFDAVAGTTYWVRLEAVIASIGKVAWRQRWDHGRPTVGAQLDGGASRTADSWTSLSLTGADGGTGLAGWYVGMVASGGEVLGAAWVPARGTTSRTIRWSLTHTGYGGTRFDGPKTVHVQTVDRQGNLSPVISRTITLDR